MKLLFATSEVAPLIKTGGLADVGGALPMALAGLGVDVRIVLPAYRGLSRRLSDVRRVGGLAVRGQDFTVLEARHDSLPPLWLLDCPALYDRPGDPYHDANRTPWGDNAWRFGCYAEAVARLAMGEGGTGWTPDIVHANDWQAGLVPSWLAEHVRRPRTVFTIHNLAFQGVHSHAEFEALGLPQRWWHHEQLEFHGGFSFMKGGIVHADALTTVSPTYALEIQTPAFGYGLDGLLRHRAKVLSGILNGIDDEFWNPEKDPLIPQRYTAATVDEGKAANKASLQAEMGLAVEADAVLIGIVSRMAYQKGTDLTLAALPKLLQLPVQFAVLGSGEKAEERGWQQAAALNPDRVAVRIAYDEGLAHRIEAGADLFLMPSRYEPCGLNQMYSQRYGTPPLVHRTGGLADTVTDATPHALKDGNATGVTFDNADVGGVLYGVRRGVELMRDPVLRRQLRRAGMARDFSWSAAAREYLKLYAGPKAGV